MKKLSLLLSLFVLSGCARLYVHRYENVDLKNKTITVPTGSDGLKGALKQSLKEDGWLLAIDRAPSKIKGSFGEKTDIEVSNKFKTKYRMKVTSRWVDYCVFPITSIGDDFVVYEVSVVNNHTGMEVFSINGRDCLEHIAEDFMEEIKKEEVLEDNNKDLNIEQ